MAITKAESESTTISSAHVPRRTSAHSHFTPHSTFRLVFSFRRRSTVELAATCPFTPTECAEQVDLILWYNYAARVEMDLWRTPRRLHPSSRRSAEEPSDAVPLAHPWAEHLPWTSCQGTVALWWWRYGTCFNGDNISLLSRYEYYPQ